MTIIILTPITIIIIIWGGVWDPLGILGVHKTLAIMAPPIITTGCARVAVLRYQKLFVGLSGWTILQNAGLPKICSLPFHFKLSDKFDQLHEYGQACKQIVSGPKMPITQLLMLLRCSCKNLPILSTVTLHILSIFYNNTLQLNSDTV